MLHADAADALFRVAPDSADMLIETGVQVLAPLLLKKQSATPESTALTDLFIPRWYSYVARMVSAYGYTKRAHAIVVKGLQRFEKSPDLYLARGTIAERELQLTYPDLKGDLLDGGLARRPSRDWARVSVNLNGQLERVAADYQRAIDLDPSYASALIRLGRIRFLRHEPTAATGDLTRALNVASDSRDRYLALLIRGAVAERNGRMDVAVLDYEQARSAVDTAQTACVALVHARAMIGDHTRARELAAECLVSSPQKTDAPDPWWLFRDGLTEPGAGEWLHKVAWQR